MVKKSFLNTALLILKNSKRSVFCRQLKQITVEKKKFRTNVKLQSNPIQRKRKQKKIPDVSFIIIQHTVDNDDI